MAHEPHHFDLVDGDDVVHSYTLTLHHPTSGVPIALKLASLLSGPLLESITALMQSGRPLGELLDIDLDDLSKSFGGVSPGDLAKALAAALADPQLGKLMTHDLMGNVHRDGKALSVASEFDKAFMGNYGELYRLAFEVVKRNRFLVLLRT